MAASRHLLLAKTWEAAASVQLSSMRSGPSPPSPGELSAGPFCPPVFSRRRFRQEPSRCTACWAQTSGMAGQGGPPPAPSGPGERWWWWSSVVRTSGPPAGRDGHGCACCLALALVSLPSAHILSFSQQSGKQAGVPRPAPLHPAGQLSSPSPQSLSPGAREVSASEKQSWASSLGPWNPAPFATVPLAVGRGAAWSSCPCLPRQVSPLLCHCSVTADWGPSEQEPRLLGCIGACLPWGPQAVL